MCPISATGYSAKRDEGAVPVWHRSYHATNDRLWTIGDNLAEEFQNAEFRIQEWADEGRVVPARYFNRSIAPEGDGLV